MVGHVKEIYGNFFFPKNKAQDHCTNPNYPNGIFYVISKALFRHPVIYRKQTLLHASHRAQPAAENSAQKNRTKQHTEKYNKITLIKEGEAEPGDEVLSLS